MAGNQDPTARFAFQAVLHPDGTIQFNYRFVPNDPASAAVVIDASAMADTTIDCSLAISTNDPRTPGLTLPVHVQVTAVSAVGEVASPPAARFALYQNRPNPFSPSTRIAFALPNPEHVSLRVFDVSGRLVSTLLDGPMPAGRHEVEWSAPPDAVGPGLYFYRLQAGTFVATRKMLRVP